MEISSHFIWLQTMLSFISCTESTVARLFQHFLALAIDDRRPKSTWIAFWSFRFFCGCLYETFIAIKTCCRPWPNHATTTIFCSFAFLLSSVRLSFACRRGRRFWLQLFDVSICESIFLLWRCCFVALLSQTQSQSLCVLPFFRSHALLIVPSRRSFLWTNASEKKKKNIGLKATQRYDAHNSYHKLNSLNDIVVCCTPENGFFFVLPFFLLWVDALFRISYSQYGQIVQFFIFPY